MSIDWKERLGYVDPPSLEEEPVADGSALLDLFSSPGLGRDWSDYEDEAHSASKRCRDTGTPYVVSEYTLSGLGDINDLPSLIKVQLADIAYLDGELIKHRWKTEAQIRAEQDDKKRPPPDELPDTLQGLAELYADLHADAPSLDLLSPGGHKHTCVIPLCDNGAVWSSKLRPPELDYICVECVRRAIRRKLDEIRTP